jgi:hypothetical protein
MSGRSQPPLYLRKRATFQMCPCVHSNSWRTFRAFVVKCDLINNDNSTVIKERTCTAKVLCYLQIKYYIVNAFIV